VNTNAIANRASAKSASNPSATASADGVNNAKGTSRWWKFWSRGRGVTVHITIDAFFASVEQLLDPTLWGKAVLVGHAQVGLAKVESASEEAQLHGAVPGMSMAEGLQLCPHAAVVVPRYACYADFAERVRRILESKVGLLDTAAQNYFSFALQAKQRAHAILEAELRQLQSAVSEQTGLSISIGAASTKMLAAMASQLAGTHGIQVIAAGEENEFLTPLPIQKLPGIQAVHAALLSAHDITTVGQLRQIPKLALESAFGEFMGRQIWQRARGLDITELPRPKVSTLPKSESTLLTSRILRRLQTQSTAARAS